MGAIVGGIFCACCLVTIASFAVVRILNSKEEETQSERGDDVSFSEIAPAVDIEQTARRAT